MNAIEKLALIGIPTRSAAAAIQYMRDNGWFEKPIEDYKYLIADLGGADFPTDDEREANYTFRYLVQEAINDPELKGKDLVGLAYDKAITFIKNNQYVFAKKEDDAPPKLDAAGKPKAKKGAKKERAIQVYNEKIKDKITSRKEAIEILVAEAGLTKGGASTYYANLKAGRM